MAKQARTFLCHVSRMINMSVSQQVAVRLGLLAQKLPEQAKSWLVPPAAGYWIEINRSGKRQKMSLEKAELFVTFFRFCSWPW